MTLRQYYDIGVDRIRPSPHNPRKTVDEAALAELAESIRAVGLLEPLIVRQWRGGDGYELVCGERRWRAAQAAGLEEVACRVIIATDQQALELALTENSQRKDVDPFEEGAAIAQLVGYGRDIAEVAARLGRTPRWVRRRLALRSVPGELVEIVRAGRMPLAGAELVASCLPTVREAFVEKVRLYEHHEYQWPLRRVRNELRDLASRALRTALWDLEDETMKAAGGHPGACASCPQRSISQLDLWGDDGGEAPGLCLDAPCFGRRADEHRRRVVAAAEAAGAEVLAPDWRVPGGYLPLTDDVPISLAVRLGLRTVDDIDLEEGVELDEADPGAGASGVLLDEGDYQDGREVTWRDVLEHLGQPTAPDALAMLKGYGQGEVPVSIVRADRLAAALEEAGEGEVAQRLAPPVRDAAPYEQFKADAAARAADAATRRERLWQAWCQAGDDRRAAALALVFGVEPSPMPDGAQYGLAGPGGAIWAGFGRKLSKHTWQEGAILAALTGTDDPCTDPPSPIREVHRG